MFDKLTPNQRLVVAVLLSIIFFVGYTAIFPPAKPAVDLAKADPNKVELKDTNSKTDITDVVENISEDAKKSQQKVAKSASNNIVTITNKNFIY